jgi:hypothetical protein
MDHLLVLTLVVDAAAGLACIRARRYWHAIALAGIAVPVALIVTAVMFAALEHGQAIEPATFEVRYFLTAVGGLAVAVVAVGWMATVAVGSLLERRQMR